MRVAPRRRSAASHGGSRRSALGVEDLHRARKHDAALRALDARPHALAGNRAGHEHHPAVVAREHPAAGDGPLDVERQRLRGRVTHVVQRRQTPALAKQAVDGHGDGALPGSGRQPIAERREFVSAPRGRAPRAVRGRGVAGGLHQQPRARAPRRGSIASRASPARTLAPIAQRRQLARAPRVRRSRNASGKSRRPAARGSTTAIDARDRGACESDGRLCGPRQAASRSDRPHRRLGPPGAVDGRTPTARRQSSKIARTSSSQNSMRSGRVDAAGAMALGLQLDAAIDDAQRNALVAHPRTSSKPGPTMRTRWPPLTRVRWSSTCRQYSPTSIAPPAVVTAVTSSATRQPLPLTSPATMRVRRGRRRRRAARRPRRCRARARAAPRRAHASARARRRARAPPNAATPDSTQPRRSSSQARHRRRASARAARRPARARSTARPSSVSIDVARSAISGGYAACAQVDADADDDRVDARAGARRPRTACRRASATAGRSTRSFGHFSSTGKPRRRAHRVAAATPAASVSSDSVRSGTPRPHDDREIQPRAGRRKPRRARAARGRRAACRRAPPCPRGAPATPSAARGRSWTSTSAKYRSARERRRAAAPRATSASARSRAADRTRELGTGLCRTSISRLMSAAGAECVSAPTDTQSAPIAASAAARSSVTPPEISTRARPRDRGAPPRASSASSKLSSMMMSAPAASAASTSSRLCASTSIGSLRAGGAHAPHGLGDAAGEPNVVVLDQHAVVEARRDGSAPPPQRTAYLASARSVGVVLRVSRIVIAAARRRRRSAASASRCRTGAAGN